MTSSLRLNEPFRWGKSPETLEVKAVTGAGVNAYMNGTLLHSWLDNPQDKAKTFLRAYKLGWFYKAERKISADIAGLDWNVSDGDVESEDVEETVLPHPDLDIPFDQLTEIEQFIRLLERPNPNQTGKALLQKTQIRRDMAGAAFWYLENGDVGLPTAIYGISPSRMWPSRDQQGNLIGWVMDKDRPSGGIPFSINEIIAFPMATSDDDDLFGVGVVEAVYAELPLTDLMARHTGDLLTTGGRLAGMISPKDRALSEDEFADAVRAWRNVASDPNAARRLLLFPEPMEYSAGASTPAEIGIPELAALNRDNILTAFPIAPEMLGVPMPSGLNASGESRQMLRKFYWSDTIHPRVDDLKEVIQVQIVSRYEQATGKTFDFDFEEPNLDDAPALIEKVGALKGLVSVGFDPKEAVAAVGLDHVKWLGLPDLMNPAKQAEMQREAQAVEKPVGGVSVAAGDSSRRDSTVTNVPIAKSAKAAREEARASLTDEAVNEAKDALTSFLTEQRERISERIRDTMPKSKAARKADGAWWDAEAEDAKLRGTLEGLYVKIGRGSLQVIADQLGRVVLPTAVRNVLTDLLTYGGSRITAINEVTRDAVKAQLAEGVRRGYSINQLIEGVANEGYAGVANAVLDNGVLAFDPYRAEVISRTETMLSYNRAAIDGYREFGVKEVQAIDGDGDAECAARDGHVFPVEEAHGIEDHPNGTLDWIPVFDKSSHDSIEKYVALATKAIDAMSVQPVINNYVQSAKGPDVHMDPPVVNVTTPDVLIHPTWTVEPAQVTVTPQITVESPPPSDVYVSPAIVNVNVPDQPTPVVNVTSPDVNVNVPKPVVNVKTDVKMPDEMRIMGMPSRVTRRKVMRDAEGQIAETLDVEEDA